MKSPDLQSLQILRAVAASAVILSHAVARATVAYPDLIAGSIFERTPALAAFGHSGVDLFFVVSGFVMVYAHHDRFARPGFARQFLWRRLARIVPIYWILTAAAVVLLAWRPELFTFREAIEWPWVVGSFLFIPIWTSYGLEFPVLGVGWTLNYEMYFYFVFGTCLLLERRLGLSLLAAYLCLSVGIGFVIEPRLPWLRLTTSPLLLEFLLGCLSAWSLRHFEGRLQRLVAPMLVTGVLLLVASIAWQPGTHAERLIAWGLPSALIVTGAATLRLPKTLGVSALVRIGDASYSAYLLQVFALPASAMTLKILATPEHFPLWVVLSLMVGITWAVSLCFWAAVESPLNVFLRTQLDRRDTYAAGASELRRISANTGS